MSTSGESLGTIFMEFVLDKTKFTSGLKEAESDGLKSADAIEKGFAKVGDTMKQVGMMAVAALGITGVISYAKEAMMLASRVDTLSVVLKAVGHNAGYTSSEMNKFVQETKAMGITTQAAQDSVVKMAQAQMDLTQTSKLARVAQDAAVIGNTNSSDAFQRMIYGIKTGQTEVLRTIGINVSFEESYAKMAATMGKSSASLTERQKVQARMNAVLEEGKKIEGVYEDSLGTAGKAIHSLVRYTEELQLKLGAVFQPALKIAVDALTVAFKDMGAGMQSFIDSGGMAKMAQSVAESIATLIKVLFGFGEAVGNAIKFVVEFNKELIALGVTIVAFKVGSWVSTLGTAGKALGFLGSIAQSVRAGVGLLPAVLLAASVSIQAFIAALTPLLPALAIVAAIGAAVYSVGLIKDKLNESHDAWVAYQQQVNNFDMEKVDDEIVRLTAQLTAMKAEANKAADGGFFHWLLVSGSIQKALDLVNSKMTVVLDKKALLEADAAQAAAGGNAAQQAEAKAEILRTQAAKEKSLMSAQLAALKSDNAARIAEDQKRFDTSIAQAEVNGTKEIEIMQRKKDFAYKIAGDIRDNSNKELALEYELAAKQQGANFNGLAMRIQKATEIENAYRKATGEADLILAKGRINLTVQSREAQVAYYKDMVDLTDNYRIAELAVLEDAANKKQKSLGDNFEREKWTKYQTLKIDQDIATQRTDQEIKYLDAIEADADAYISIKQKQYEAEAKLLEKQFEARFGVNAKYMAEVVVAKKITDEKIALIDKETAALTKKADLESRFLDSIKADASKYLAIREKQNESELKSLTEQLKKTNSDTDAAYKAQTIMAKQLSDYKISLWEKELAEYRRYMGVVLGATSDYSQKYIDMQLSEAAREFEILAEQLGLNPENITGRKSEKNDKNSEAEKVIDKQITGEQRLTDVIRDETAKRLDILAQYYDAMVGMSSEAAKARAAAESIRNLPSSVGTAKQYDPVKTAQDESDAIISIKTGQAEKEAMLKQAYANKQEDIRRAGYQREIDMLEQSYGKSEGYAKKRENLMRAEAKYRARQLGDESQEESIFNQMVLADNAKVVEGLAGSAAAYAGQAAEAFEIMSQMYAKDSEERKELHNMAMAFAIAEKAALLAKAVAAAVTAVATQASSGPGVGFAAMAAMAAAMIALLAQVGVSFSGGSGGGAAYGEADMKAKGYSAGTVLGAESDAVSESLKNTTKILEDIYQVEYVELKGIHDSVLQLNKNIEGLVTSIIQTGGVTDISGVPTNFSSKSIYDSGIEASLNNSSGSPLLKLYKYFDPIVGSLSLIPKLLGDVFGGGQTSMAVGAGIMFGGESLSNIKKGRLSTKQYTDIVTKTEGGWFKDDSYSLWAIIKEANAQVGDLFLQAFQNTSDLLIGLTENFGTDMDATLNYSFGQIKLNMMGLTGDEITKQLSAMFSALGDIAAEKLFGPIIKSYQKVNEGMLETAIRLVTDKAVVQSVLALTDQSFKGTIPEIIAFSESLITLSGDLSALKSNASSYFEAFFTDEEKQQHYHKQMMAVFKNLNLVLPETRNGYRQLVESLDLMTDSGKNAYVSLLQLTDTADQYYQAADAAAEAQQELIDGLKELTQTIDDWLASLTLGDLSPGGTSAEAWNTEYQRMGDKAFTESATQEQDITDFLSYAKDYLKFMQNYTGNGADYQDVFKMVTDDVRMLREFIMELAGGTNSSLYPLGDLPGYAVGGLTRGLSYAGERGAEWVIPTYEPDRSSFLSNLGIDPDKIGRSIARSITNEASGGSINGKEIHVHLYIDKKEITNSVVQGIRSGDEDLIKNLKKVSVH